MTVVEVLVASAILLFAATALLSLAIGAMTAARVAQERANVLNATASYMESIRGRSYSLIGTVGSANPTGNVEVTTTTVAGAYRIVMTPIITSVDDTAIPGPDNYKRVQVDARAQNSSGGEVMTYTVVSIVSSAGAQ